MALRTVRRDGSTRTHSTGRRFERGEGLYLVRQAPKDARRGSCGHAASGFDDAERTLRFSGLGMAAVRRLDGVIDRAFTAAHKACKRRGPDAERELLFSGTSLE